MKLYYALTTLFIVCLMACNSPTINEPSKQAISIIPKPLDLKTQPGSFSLTPQTKIVLASDNQALKDIATLFNASLQSTCGFALPIEVGASAENGLFFQTGTQGQAPEEYQLEVSPGGIKITATENSGVFYGTQTLLQLLPVSANQNPQIPAVIIKDQPRYVYRGMHLDVSRHFFPVEFVKKYIDLLATYKYNTFHWHLTDDQGWRIEIKQYPKLQEIAAFRKETLIGHDSDRPAKYDGQRYGGFYTQEEVKEVVAYAAQRFINVIPEIEMPGHAQAAISAYPELACNPGPFEPWTKWGISENVYCPYETTITFLENVLAEVIEIFPSQYIHIGGDECPKSTWESSKFCQQLMKKEGLKDEMELQSYFVRRIETFISSKGRRMIGWDEIMEGGIAEGATIMSWRGMEGGIEAARAGHDVVMTPTSHCYFDYYQSENPAEPLAIGGFLPIEKVYALEPTPDELSPQEARHILGAQANVWTEYLATPEAVEYMILPRMLAMSEVVWTAKSQRGFTDFATRLSDHFPRLEAQGYNVSKAFYDVSGAVISTAEKGLAVALQQQSPKTTIRYTLDGSEPQSDSKAYENPLPVSGNTKVSAATFSGTEKMGRVYSLAVQPHLASGKNIDLAHAPAERYAGGGAGVLINGVTANVSGFSDPEWLGFEGNDFAATIDLGESQALHTVSTVFFQSTGQWVYPPKKVSVEVSDDGKTFKPVGALTTFKEDGKMVRADFSFPEAKGRYLRVTADRHGVIAAGAQGAGHEAWLFVGEVEVR